MLPRIVAGADGMIADFAGRPLAGPSLAAMLMDRLPHCAGDDLAELQGRAAGGIFLEAMVPLDDFDIHPLRIIGQRRAATRPASSSD